VSLFDPDDLVARVTDDAVARADEHADDTWKAAATAAVVLCAATLDDFTADDVWQALDLRWPWSSTHDPRALGAVIRACARSGLIRKTGRVRPSRLVRRHGRDVAIWTTNETGASPC
jgi:hypothetical protein